MRYCVTRGVRGIRRAMNSKKTTHSELAVFPDAPRNWDTQSEPIQRLKRAADALIAKADYLAARGFSLFRFLGRNPTCDGLMIL